MLLCCECVFVFARYFPSCFFFFSSRRRHTRYWRDWSSDVCSSDLPELKEVRDLTRYRTKTVQARTSEIQRLGKALESAGIKLGSVASDITGKSATAMIEALIDGERRGQILADLAIGRMRTAGKLADLSQALTGRLTDHHASLCRLHRDRIMLFNAAVDDLERRITLRAAPYQRELELLKSIDGFGDAVAQAWPAEIR